MDATANTFSRFTPWTAVFNSLIARAARREMAASFWSAGPFCAVDSRLTTPTQTQGILHFVLFRNIFTKARFKQGFVVY